MKPSTRPIPSLPRYFLPIRTRNGVNYIYVDPREGPYEITPADIKSDNIHPTSSGSQKLANLIWNAMKSHMICSAKLMRRLS